MLITTVSVSDSHSCSIPSISEDEVSFAIAVSHGSDSRILISASIGSDTASVGSDTASIGSDTDSIGSAACVSSATAIAATGSTSGSSSGSAATGSLTCSTKNGGDTGNSGVTSVSPFVGTCSMTGPTDDSSKST